MLRRTRIKGIANIPVRRKAEASETVKIENVKEETAETSQENSEIIKELDENIASETPDAPAQILLNTVENNLPPSETVPENCEKPSEIKPLRRWLPKPKPSVRIPLSRRLKSEVSVDKSEIEVSKVHENPVLNSDINNSSSEVSASSEVPNAEIISSDSNAVQEPHSEISGANEILSTSSAVLSEHNDASNITKQTKPHETTEKVGKLEHIISDLTIKTSSETDRTLQCPLSPNKLLNRARIRPIPKLYRRNSVQGSASESEDDGRKSRIRNDSICSTQSFSTDSIIVRDVHSIKDRLRPQKLFRRSDQSRKVAEAKREFYQKFGSKIPDRKRLTMMDLIYYNPTSNPMPQKGAKQSPDEPVEIIVETLPPPEVEEPPEEVEDDQNDEEEDVNPVPQVKVGPNGEIILDEQSLVIEQTGTKKGRELLANSQIVNVDDLDRQYGIYKRVRRSKDWNVIETLRFYKSLNTVGTDFSLMLALFPGRNRRELKMKFKKEERINQQLIDKAIMNPLEFDLTELEGQLIEEERLIAIENEKKIVGKTDIKTKRRRKKSSVLALQLDEENVDDSMPQPKRQKCDRKLTLKDQYSKLENGLDTLMTSGTESDVEHSKPRPARSCVKKQKKYVDLDDISDLELIEDDPDCLNNNTKDKAQEDGLVENPVEIGEENFEKDVGECETIEAIQQEIKLYSAKEPEDTNNETQIYSDENQDDATEILEETIDENKEVQTIDNLKETSDKIDIKSENSQDLTVPNILPNDLSSVEPGSLMILSSLDPEGKQVFKVFMVAPGQTKVPVNLSPDIVESLTSSLGNAESINLDLPVICEEST